MTTWQQLAPLRMQDRIGIVAPGGALGRADLEGGLITLRTMGFEPVYTPDVFARDGYFAGPDALRGRDFAAALANPNLRGIWAARGGYGSARLLPDIAVEDVARAGKWLIGFSDISALHGLWARAGLASVHAVTANKLAGWQPAALDALRGCLMDGRRVILRGEGGLGPQTSVQGRMFGGNLTVLASLAGTGFLPPWQDGIVFFEDVGEAPYRLHRVATQLMQAGAMQGVRAVLIGQLTHCSRAPASQPPTPYAEVAMELASVFEPLEVPVVWGLPVGHEATSWPLPLGGMAGLDTATFTLTVEAVA